MLQYINAGAGALGGLLGGIGKNEAIERMKDEINRMQQNNQNWYDRRYNEDATQRADAVRALEQARDTFKRENKSRAGTEAVMGGASEATAAAKEAGNKALADITGQVTAANEARKDNIEQQYLQRKASLDNAMAELNGQKKSGWDIASDTIGGAAAGFNSGMQAEGILAMLKQGK